MNNISGDNPSVNDQGEGNTTNLQNPTGGETTQNISSGNQPKQNQPNYGHTIYKKGELAGKKQAYNELNDKLALQVANYIEK